MLRYVAHFLMLMLPLAAGAQQVTGSITGTTVDPAGGSIAGAAVKLTNQQTGVLRSTDTNSEGSYTFAAVLPGIYTISVEHPGFKKYLKQGVELTPGAEL